MRLYAVRIFVDDLTRARDVYGGPLGLPELWSGEDAVGYEAGAQVIVERALEGHGGLVGRFVGLSLEVDDIWETHRDLSARGVSFTGPPERQDWGGTLAHFRDPAGNVLTLVGGAPALDPAARAH